MPNTPLKNGKKIFFGRVIDFCDRTSILGDCVPPAVHVAVKVLTTSEAFLFCSNPNYLGCFWFKTNFWNTTFFDPGPFNTLTAAGFLIFGEIFKIFDKFLKSSNACSTKFYKIIRKNIFDKKCWKLSVDDKYIFAI